MKNKVGRRKGAQPAHGALYAVQGFEDGGIGPGIAQEPGELPGGGQFVFNEQDAHDGKDGVKPKAKLP